VSRLDTPSDGPSASEEVRLRARVKWFDPARGYGFVLPEDGDGTAFLHISVLNRAGLHGLSDGATVVCRLVAGPKGRQVAELIEVIEAEPGADASTDAGTIELGGVVKWFKPDKGFGFVVPEDGGPDVFVHKSVLRHCGLTAMDTGQRVRLKVRDNPKGREAVWIGPTSDLE
jgi:cold shock protein